MFVLSSNKIGIFDREVIFVVILDSRLTPKIHKPLVDEYLREATWQLYRSLKHEWQMIRQAAA
jgi:hypothetical protein